jgi:methionyl-tRNA formyltransferase
VHPSLLPRWRGAAPIQRAILAGDTRTGVTIMQMEKGLDTGPMLALLLAEIDRKTAGELTGELAALGAGLMVEVLAELHRIGPRPQPERGVTYAPKIEKQEARLDFSRPGAEVERQVRAFNPAPGAWFEHRGERIKIHACDLSDAGGEPGTVLDDSLAIACAEGAIIPISVQRPGRAPMSAEELLRGFEVPPGTRLA